MTGVLAPDSLLSQRHQGRSAVPCLSGLTIFCDFDGPIVDVSDRYYATYQLGLSDVYAFYQAQGINLPIQRLQKEQFWQMKQDRVPDLEIAIRSGLQSEQIDVFLRRVAEIVNQPALLSRDRLQPGVNWALSLLHSQGVRLVLVTLRCQEQATQILQTHGLAHLFSSIRGTRDKHAAYHNLAQHKTDLLAEALEESMRSGQFKSRSAAHTPSAWMIGDTEADVLAGQAHGIPTIALTCGIRSRSYLQNLEPTCIYPDLLFAAHSLVIRRGAICR